MTDDTMALRGLSKKSADVDLRRELTGFAAQHLTELEVGGLTGGAHGERSGARLNQRQGYREWDWETPAETVEFRISELWRGSYCPAFQDPQRTTERALRALACSPLSCRG